MSSFANAENTASNYKSFHTGASKTYSHADLFGEDILIEDTDSRLADLVATQLA